MQYCVDGCLVMVSAKQLDGLNIWDEYATIGYHGYISLG